MLTVDINVFAYNKHVINKHIWRSLLESEVGFKSPATSENICSMKYAAAEESNPVIFPDGSYQQRRRQQQQQASNIYTRRHESVFSKKSFLSIPDIETDFAS